jgi:hypothetical protein
MDDTPKGPVLKVRGPQDNLITIHKGGTALVSISLDGVVTYGEGYNPDDAARIFWDGIAAKRPKCPHCGKGIS